MKKLVFLIVTMFGVVALGAEAQAIDLSWIERLIAMIPTDATTIMLIGAGLEFLLRYIPSAQPMSVMKWVSELCKHLAELLAAVSIFLDKVIGQRTLNASHYNPPMPAKK